MLKKIYSLALIFIACKAFASASTGMGNGGDGVVLEFMNTGYDVYSFLLRHPNAVNEIDSTVFLTTLLAAQISSTDNSLFVNGLEKDAENFPAAAPQQIQINRARWQSLTNEKDKWSLVAHEVFDLMELDDSKFNFSSSLLTALNASSCDTNCGAFQFETVQLNYSLLSTVIPANLTGKWVLTGWTHVASQGGVYDPTGLTLTDNLGPNTDTVRAELDIQSQGPDFFNKNNIYSVTPNVSAPTGITSLNADLLDYMDHQTFTFYPTALAALGCGEVLAFTIDNTRPGWSPNPWYSFHYECRLVSPTRLLCAKRLQGSFDLKTDAVKDDEFYYNPSTVEQFDNTVVAYEAYELLQ